MYEAHLRCLEMKILGVLLIIAFGVVMFGMAASVDGWKEATVGLLIAAVLVWMLVTGIVLVAM